jgi:hypothetical protein
LGKSDIGSQQVGADGAATYSFPMGPVSLAYHSNKGWYVAGYSVITRSGRKGVPRYNNADLFELDGEELIYIGIDSDSRGPYLEFRTKRESWQKIHFYDYETNNSYWIVFHPDGSRSEYGTSSVSQINAVGGKNPGKIRAWAISKRYSRGEHELAEYEYEEDHINGGFYLTNVILSKYIGTGDIAEEPYLFCELTYATSEYPRLNCRSGSFVLDNKILSEVRVYRGYRQYLLNKYVVESGYGEAGEWQVKKITPYGADGTSVLPATAFEYHELPIDVSVK